MRISFRLPRYRIPEISDPALFLSKEQSCGFENSFFESGSDFLENLESLLSGSYSGLIYQEGNKGRYGTGTT